MVAQKNSGRARAQTLQRLHSPPTNPSRLARSLLHQARQCARVLPGSDFPAEKSWRRLLRCAPRRQQRRRDYRYSRQQLIAPGPCAAVVSKAFNAPRGLNEPVGRSLSIFKWTRAPERCASDSADTRRVGRKYRDNNSRVCSTSFALGIIAPTSFLTWPCREIERARKFDSPFALWNRSLIWCRH